MYAIFSVQHHEESAHRLNMEKNKTKQNMLSNMLEKVQKVLTVMLYGAL